MKTFRLYVFLILLSCLNSLNGQEIRRQELRLPESILGYKVLKCDFHMHTVFSDGTVWPTVRVDEAVQEGLDAIAITEHVEISSRMSYIGMEDTMSLNTAYRIAKQAGDRAGVIVIPGVEITKVVPPGHFNAIFIKDADRFKLTLNPDDPQDGTYIRAALKEAKSQGAFVFWNHPWFRVKNNESIWIPIIDSLYNEKLIDGIEVVNATKYDPVILGWVQSKNLANMSNTDVHAPMKLWKDEYRTMTIVFAEERSVESIHEALLDRRSVAYCRDHLYGDEKYLEAIFHESVDMIITHDGHGNGYLTVSNRSSIPYRIKFIDTKDITFQTYSGGITVPRNGDTAVRLQSGNKDILHDPVEIVIDVENLEVSPNTPLRTRLLMDFKSVH